VTVAVHSRRSAESFLNLCYHEEDYHFTTAECAGLQATTRNHILVPKHSYKWATQNIVGITSFYIIQNEIKVCFFSLTDELWFAGI
jgi:hypothetical protein